MNRRLAPFVLLAAVLLVAYWPTLADMAGRWWNEANYNHGFLVPLVSVALLWRRREQRPPLLAEPSWAGLPFFVVGGLLYAGGAYFFYGWFSGLAVVPWLAGLAVLAGGLPALRWAGSAILYLAFMIPLPFALQVALGSPLQSIATKASTYLLQTLGLPALAEGNVILLNDAKIGVVEACNGLGMLLLFFAVCTAVALVVRRPLLDRIVLVLSAAPIAVGCNVLRVTVTGVLYETVGARTAEVVFHDLAGWLMMPLALVLLWLELKFLGRLLVVPKQPEPLTDLLAPPPPRSTPKATPAKV